MMKRTRALENRQYRRTVKKPKFSESNFLSVLSWDYIRLFCMWVSCIAFDLMVGCRLELGYSIVLFVRHYSEMVGAPNGNLKFHSTFSIFYLFMTLMSDLICYLFFPVQKLLFIASTYVWLQVAYQTTDRVLNSTCLGFCFVFFCFEYFIRYQITSPKWYESKGLLLTASLAPTITDAYLANQMSTTRIAFYRVFAAHTLGFPLVTFGCRLKNVLSEWVSERKRGDVQKKNQLFDRILTEAIPSVYDGKKRHEINSRQHLALEGDALDFELDPTGSDFLDEPKYYLSQGPVPSIFDKLGNAPTPQSIKTSVEGGVPFNRKPTKKISGNFKHQNNTTSMKHKKSAFAAHSNGNSTNHINEDDYLNDVEERSEDSSYVMRKRSSPKVVKMSAWLVSTARRFFASWLLSMVNMIYCTGTSVVEHVKTMSNGLTTEAAAALMGDNARGEDEASTSVDGSQNCEDDESDRESVLTNTAGELERNGNLIKHYQQQQGNGWGATGSKKKNKKHRGRTPVGEGMDGEFELAASTSTNGSTPSVGIKNKKAKQGQQQWTSSPGEDKSEGEIERLQSDLRAARLIESELREQISGLHQYEKSAKNEVQQFRARFDQLDVKYKQLVKQQEQNKSLIGSLEKKVGDTQHRRDQLERELLIERSATVLNKSTDIKNSDSLVDALKAKVIKYENDLKKMRNEVRIKEDLSIRLETKLRDVENQSRVAQKTADDGSLILNRLETENTQLKKALSEENRVKQDLFLALKTSKAKIDLLQSKLKCAGAGVADEVGDSANSSNNSSSTLGIGLSPATTNGGCDMYRISPTNSSSPPPMSTSYNFHDLDSLGFHQFGGIRSSPSEYLRDSPTTSIAQLMSSTLGTTQQQQHLTTTHSS